MIMSTLIDVSSSYAMETKFSFRLFNSSSRIAVSNYINLFCLSREFISAVNSKATLTRFVKKQ